VVSDCYLEQIEQNATIGARGLFVLGWRGCGKKIRHRWVNIMVIIRPN